MREKPGRGQVPVEIPDLELPVAPAKPAPRAPVAPRPPEGAPSPASPGSGRSHDPSDYFGSGTFDDEAFADALEPSGSLAIDAQALAPNAGPEPRPAERWPTGRSPERAVLRVDELDVKLVADYGTPPASALLEPVYALRVRARQRLLAAELARIESELRAAEQRRDELLGELVLSLKPRLEADQRLSALLEPVRELERLAGERARALANVDAEYRALAQPVDARIGESLRQLEAHRELERERQSAFDKDEELFRRADARAKRIQIELRSLMQVAVQAAASAGLPQGSVRPDDAAKIKALQAEGATAERAADAARQALAATESARAAARAEVARTTRALRALEVERGALDDRFSKPLDARAHGLSEAEAGRQQALAEAGRSLLALRGGVDIDASTLEALRRADELVSKLTSDSEKHLRALDSADRTAVRRGYTVAGVGLAAIVLLLALLLFG